MDEIMLKIDNVSKMYRLGQIGGTTLRDELQRMAAKLRHREDPTKRIGTKNINQGEKFMALNGVSFEVRKGERVGIIGHNGAGKSTLLKLISRVTAPTGGTISMNGRVASMLEVGTGFHGELTGRENIYMNGAILGMTKKEIDSKIEDIIDFSECRQFIDTPVKRYSSGMYVKLAFSVAAHLVSEIMIMDEVLAVGDMNFQQKCLKKMRDVSIESNKTILYVSHNMETIRQLCDRVVVLDHGSVIYDGEVEEGIGRYLNKRKAENKNHYVLSEYEHDETVHGCCQMISLDVNNTYLNTGDKLFYSIKINSDKLVQRALLRIVVFGDFDSPVGTAYSDEFKLLPGTNTVNMCLDTSVFIDGNYCADFVLLDYDKETQMKHDAVKRVMSFSIEENNFVYGVKWLHRGWGKLLLKCNLVN